MNINMILIMGSNEYKSYKKYFNNINVLEVVSFDKLPSIYKHSFDYIMISTDYDVIAIAKKLLKLGVDKSKIISSQILKISNMWIKCLSDRFKETYKNEYKLIVLGDSGAFFWFNNKNSIIKAINLSFPGQDYHYDYKWLQLCLNKNVTHVLLNIGMQYFNYKIEDAENSKYRVECFYEPIFSGNDSFENKIINKRKMISKIIENISNQFIDVSSVSMLESIYQKPINKNFSQLSIMEKKLQVMSWVPKVGAHRNKSKVQYNTQLLENMLCLLNKNNIFPIFYVSPVTKYVYNYINEDEKEECYGIMHSLKKRYSFDFYDLYEDKSFNDSHFKDCLHLNKKGMIKMTEKINNYLLKRI